MEAAGKPAIVTGAASGIGAALAIALCDAGCKVLGVDLNAEGLARTAAQTLRDHGDADRFSTACADIRDRDTLPRLIDDFADQHQRLDYLFNNAGIAVGGNFADMNEEQVARIFDINLMAVVHGTRIACRRMRAQGFGHIVNTASSAGLMPVPWSTAYSATKHAVIGLSLSLRVEARTYGVSVSAVCPGLVDTGIFDAAVNIAEYNYRATVDAMPMSKVSSADAAKAILDGVRRDRALIIFPAVNRLILRLHHWFPRLIDYFSERQLIAQHKQGEPS